MLRNEGKADRLIRAAVIAPIAVIVAVLVGPGTTVGIIALVVAAVMFLTGVTGFCGLYRLFGISTCAVPERR